MIKKESLLSYIQIKIPIIAVRDDWYKSFHRAKELKPME